MRFPVQLVAAITLMACPLARAGEVIERIVARVNSHIVLESELQDALRFQCLVESRDPAGVTAEERRQMLDRLIDQALIREQMEAAGYAGSGDGEVTKRVAEIRAQVPGAASEEGWQAALQRYQLTEQDVAARVATQLDLLRFVDQRFRPAVNIGRRAIEDYYLQHLIPELHRNGGTEVPLKQVSDQIREILVQQRIDELLAAWLRGLRSQVEVRLP